MDNKQVDVENAAKKEVEQVKMHISTEVKPATTADTVEAPQTSCESDVTSSEQKESSDNAGNRQAASPIPLEIEGQNTPKAKISQIFPHPEYEARLAPIKEKRRAAKRKIQLAKGNFSNFLSLPLITCYFGFADGPLSINA